MKIEVKKARVIDQVYSSGWGYGRTNPSTFNLSNNTEDYIESDVYNFYYKIAKNPKTVKYVDVKEGSKVYFMSSAVFPRHKLKEMKNLSITRKIENADYVVVNKDALNNACTYISERTYYEMQDGTVVNRLELGYVRSFNAHTPWTWKSNIHKFLELEKLADKQLILDSDLSTEVPREVEIQGDLYSKLHKMLGCKDRDTIRVGTTILSNLNYKEHELEVVLLLNKNYDNMRAYRATQTVAFQSLLAAVSKDYPNFNTCNKLGFLLEILDRNRDDEITRNSLSEYMNNVHKLSVGKYKIEIVDDLEVQQ